MAVTDGAAEQCATRGHEIQAVLRLADERWQELEERVHATEEAALHEQFKVLEEPLGLQTSDLDSWMDGSLRQKVRGRVGRLVLAPLAELMRQQVCLPDEAIAVRTPTSPTAGSCEAPRRHILDDLAERWEVEVEPLLLAAGVEDAKLERKAHRKAQVTGCAREVWKAETQERPAAWISASKALEALMPFVQRLAGFLAAQVSPAAIEHLAAATPAVVARAICDWRFQRCAAEFDQLDGWWHGARKALQKREGLWEELVKEEGVFVRRVERGVELLRAARSRYEALADFGATPACPGHAEAAAMPEGGAERLQLLAEAVKDMRTRLRPIRDSAAWRVVDAAKLLQRRRGAANGGSQREPTPWERSSRQGGARELEEALTAEGSGEHPRTLADAADAALVFVQRLDRFSATIGDLLDFARSLPPPANAGPGFVGLLERVLQAATAANEDALGLMDEPTDEGVLEWRRHWETWGVDVDAAALEAAAAAVVWKPESALSADERRARTRHVALLRGLQAFVEDATFRSALLAPSELRPRAETAAAAPAGASVASAGAAEDAAAVDEPPTPTAAATLSPRGAAAVRYAPPRRVVLRREEPSSPASPESGAKEEAEPPPVEEEATTAAPQVAPVPAPAAAAAEAPASATSSPGASRPSTAETWTRPSTPSWLQPPWPRPDTPSAASWLLRPDTPSTVCDDAELASLPRVKFVDGQRVTLRPGTGARLPPLRPLIS